MINKKLLTDLYFTIISSHTILYKTIRLPLIFLSFIYAGIGDIRNLLFTLNIKRSTKLNVPVISVGNITAGGGGKTPLVCLLIEIFISQNIKPSVISRGYGAQTGQLNDEALLIKQRYNIDVFCHPKRVIAAKQAVDNGAKVIIADDAFGHRQLYRDIDILVLPPHNPWGFKRTFPAGLLRESLKNLKRANIIINQSSDTTIKPLIDKFHIEAPIIPATKRAGVPKSLKDNQENPDIKQAILACGIAQPQSFIKSAQEKNIKIIECITFSDHYDFSKLDAKALHKKAQGEILLITEKDAVKLKAFIDYLPETYYLPIQMYIKDLNILKQMCLNLNLQKHTTT